MGLACQHAHQDLNLGVHVPPDFENWGYIAILGGTNWCSANIDLGKFHSARLCHNAWCWHLCQHHALWHSLAEWNDVENRKTLTCQLAWKFFNMVSACMTIWFSTGTPNFVRACTYRFCQMYVQQHFLYVFHVLQYVNGHAATGFQNAKG